MACESTLKMLQKPVSAFKVTQMSNLLALKFPPQAQAVYFMKQIKNNFIGGPKPILEY